MVVKMGSEAPYCDNPKGLWSYLTFWPDYISLHGMRKIDPKGVCGILRPQEDIHG